LRHGFFANRNHDSCDLNKLVPYAQSMSSACSICLRISGSRLISHCVHLRLHEVPLHRMAPLPWQCFQPGRYSRQVHAANISLSARHHQALCVTPVAWRLDPATRSPLQRNCVPAQFLPS
jgi:hypothetical protein